VESIDRAPPAGGPLSRPALTRSHYQPVQKRTAIGRRHQSVTISASIGRDANAVSIYRQAS
jgi:hypothetical protein